MYVVHNYNKPSVQVHYPKTLVVEHMHAIHHTQGKYLLCGHAYYYCSKNVTGRLHCMEYNIRQTATLHVTLLWSSQSPCVTMYAFMWRLVIIGVPIYSINS